jgi:hypothetical protein
MGDRVRSVAVCRHGMGTGCGRMRVGSSSIVDTYRRCAGRMYMIRGHAASAGIPSSSAIAEAMVAPAVAVAPTSPWTHAQENAVIEIARAIEADGGARVRCVVVVAVGAGRLDADDNLGPGCWCQG